MINKNGYYIVIFTSVDYYTLYDGYQIVKADNEEIAINKAVKKLGYSDGKLPSYKSVEDVIFCGSKKPKN